MSCRLQLVCTSQKNNWKGGGLCPNAQKVPAVGKRLMGGVEEGRYLMEHGLTLIGQQLKLSRTVTTIRNAVVVRRPIALMDKPPLVNTQLNVPDQKSDKTSAFIDVLTLTDDQSIQ